MKRALSIVLACSMALSLVTYGDGSKPTEAPTTTAAGDTTIEVAADTTVADIAAAPEVGVEIVNKDKPLVQFNHQPSSSTAGQLDMTALDFNKGTYHVGFGINQGAEPQGIMIKGYIKKNTGLIGRNGGGITGYVLTIGSIEYNDSIAYTRDIRKVLSTAVERDGNVNSDPVGTDADGAAAAVQDSSIEAGGKTYIIRKLASQETKNSAGATWDVATAGNAIDTWSFSLGDQIGIVASNNDGMGISMLNAWPKDNKVPTFSYDANSDAVAAIAESHSGTISQHTGVQAYLTLRVLRNALDGIGTDADAGTADDADNVLSPDVYVYKADEHPYYALNVAVTAENYTDFTDSTMVYAPASNQPDEATHATKNVWLNVYNPADNFLGPTYQPLFQKYDKFLNFKVDYIGGDGQTESNITNRLGNPSQYDVFATNMVKTDNAVSYTFLLEQ